MKKTGKPIVAGILCIILGSLWFLGEVFLFLYGFFYIVRIAGMAALFFGMMAILCSPNLILGIISLYGGIFMCKRTKWRVAVAGSVCSILIGLYLALLTLGGLFHADKIPYWLSAPTLLTLLLSIPALILVVLSKKEFVPPVKPDLSAPS